MITSKAKYPDHYARFDM